MGITVLNNLITTVTAVDGIERQAPSSEKLLPSRGGNEGNWIGKFPVPFIIGLVVIEAMDKSRMEVNALFGDSCGD